MGHFYFITHKPMLVEEKADKVHVYAGGAMYRRLLVVLGPRRALRIMKFGSRSSEIGSSHRGERRHFLKLIRAAAIGAAALMIPEIGHADGGHVPDSVTAGSGGNNPLAELEIIAKKQLEGTQAKAALDRAFGNRDVQVTLERYPGELKPIAIEKATLSAKKTDMLFGAFEVTGKNEGVLLFVLLNRPVGWLNTYALFFKRERDLDKEKRILADMSSVNGRAVADLEAIQSRIKKEEAAEISSSDPCGGCYNPFYFYCYAPVGIDFSCLLRKAP